MAGPPRLDLVHKAICAGSLGQIQWKDAALRLPRGCGLHRGHVGRANAEVVADAWGEDRPPYQRGNNVRQEQIGYRFKLVTGGGMSGDPNAQLAQVFYRAPHLGPRSTQLLGNSGAADNKRRIVTQQLNDAAETSISRAFGR